VFVVCDDQDLDAGAGGVHEVDVLGAGALGEHDVLYLPAELVALDDLDAGRLVPTHLQTFDLLVGRLEIHLEPRVSQVGQEVELLGGGREQLDDFVVQHPLFGRTPGAADCVHEVDVHSPLDFDALVMVLRLYVGVIGPDQNVVAVVRLLAHHHAVLALPAHTLVAFIPLD